MVKMRDQMEKGRFVFYIDVSITSIDLTSVYKQMQNYWILIVDLLRKVCLK